MDDTGNILGVLPEQTQHFQHLFPWISTNSMPWSRINDAPARFLDGTGVAACVSRFDVEGVVAKVDGGLENDVEDSGYAQRLAIVEDLSFLFGGIHV